MKTLILYATKYGAAREIAQRIAGKIDGSVICDLKQDDIPPLGEFDCVILGSSIYAGMIRKEAQTFLSQNADLLREKKTGLFLSGMNPSPEQENNYFKANFSQDILQAAKIKSVLGGIFDPKKAGFMERFIMKMVAKQSKYTDTISDDKIEKFAEVMKS